jgi:hypothetical protein
MNEQIPKKQRNLNADNINLDLKTYFMKWSKLKEIGRNLSTIVELQFELLQGIVLKFGEMKLICSFTRKCKLTSKV